MSTPPRAAERFTPLLLALLAAAAFANTLPNGFVWLDHWQVESGGLIARSWSELIAAFRQPLGSMPGWHGSAPYARPGVVAALSLVHWIGGIHPFAFHLAVVVLHAGNAVLVYGLLRDLAVAQGVALLACALFAVHPLQTAAVAWISGIADPLFTLFTLAAFRLQLAVSRRGRYGRVCRVAALVGFAGALSAKETAAALPFLLIAAYMIFPPLLAPCRIVRARAIVTAVAPFFVVLAADAAYRFKVLRQAAFGAGLAAVPFSTRLWTLPRLVCSYLTLPLRFGALTIADDYRLSVGWDAWSVIAAIALLVLIVALIRSWRRFPHAAFGIVWMLVGLFPALNLVPILHYRADRFFYFPFIGWSLACVVLIRRGADCLADAAQRRRIMSAETLRRGVGFAAAAGVAALVLLTLHRNALFADDVSLFEATVRVSPFCREARTALGDAYLRAGRFEDAAQQYERALAPEPGRASYVVLPKVLINLGMARLARNDFAAAATAFDEAHRLQPGLLHPLFGLGVANLGLGRVSEAATWLQRAYAVDANDPDVVFNLALSYDRLGRLPEALQLYRRYLEIAPHGRARRMAESRVQALAASGQ